MKKKETEVKREFFSDYRPTAISFEITKLYCIFAIKGQNKMTRPQKGKKAFGEIFACFISDIGVLSSFLNNLHVLVSSL